MTYAGRNDEASLIEHRADIRQHMRTSAKHGTIRRRIEGWQAGIGKKLSGFDQMRDAPVVYELLTCHSGVVNQLFPHDLAEVLIIGQLILDIVRVSQFAFEPDAMDQHDAFETLVNVWVLDDTHERRQAGPRGKQVQTLAG